MTKFPPGMYRMRNGEKAEVFAERDGELWGRYFGEHRIWWAANWHGSDGKACVMSNHDLISPWTEERKPFECWVNRYDPEDSPGGHGAHFTRDDADRAADYVKRIGPAIHMIEATPLTLAAGEMLEMLERFVRPSKDVTRYDEARALICRARGET